MVPDGDFYACLKSQQATVVTDHIERFDANGIVTRGGVHLHADLVVAATGLTLQHNFRMSTISVDIDGVAYDAPHHFFFYGCMLSGVPNFVFTIGHSNIAWTIKSDLTAKYFCDLINHCDQLGAASFCPDAHDVPKARNGVWSLSSGYLARAAPRMPKQGDASSNWTVGNDVFADIVRYRWNGFPRELHFERAVRRTGHALMARL